MNGLQVLCEQPVLSQLTIRSLATRNLQLDLTKSLINLALVIGIAICLNVLGCNFSSYLDLTEEKRFTLTQPTTNLLQKLDDKVFVQVLLEGDFPAGFKRLQRATQDMLIDFRSVSSYIEYEFDDPSRGSIEEINARREQLKKDGIRAKNLFIEAGDERKQVLIYPYAIVHYKGRSIPLDILGEDVPGVPSEVALNNAVGLLEYKLANAIQKLQITRKPAIAFTKGHEELTPLEVRDFSESLLPFYDVGFLHLDSVVYIHPEIAVLIIAKPRTVFSEKDKFKIDQYVMNGGKVMWLIDALNVSLDSMRRQNQYTPLPYSDDLLNLENILYNYGARINTQLVLDLKNSRIPQVVDERGTQKLVPWYYHLVASGNPEHPITKSTGLVNLFFPNTIDSIRTKTPVKKTFLLSSSERSRVQFFPMRLNFEILKYKPEVDQFNKGEQPMALMLEGIFRAHYENRATPSVLDAWQQVGQEFKTESLPTKMLVVADGDIIKNPANPATKSYGRCGYNPYEKFAFANKDFLINSIEYLMDTEGVIVARTREVKLRLLDQVRAEQEKTKWQIINIGLPLLLLLLFGLVYNYLRKRRYAY